MVQPSFGERYLGTPLFRDLEQLQTPARLNQLIFQGRVLLDLCSIKYCKLIDKPGWVDFKKSVVDQVDNQAEIILGKFMHGILIERLKKIWLFSGG